MVITVSKAQRLKIGLGFTRYYGTYLHGNIFQSKSTILFASGSCTLLRVISLICK